MHVSRENLTNPSVVILPKRMSRGHNFRDPYSLSLWLRINSGKHRLQHRTKYTLSGPPSALTSAAFHLLHIREESFHWHHSKPAIPPLSGLLCACVCARACVCACVCCRRQQQSSSSSDHQCVCATLRIKRTLVFFRVCEYLVHFQQWDTRCSPRCFYLSLSRWLWMLNNRSSGRPDGPFL